MKIRIESYYDVTCDKCTRSRSTDFEKGMEYKKSILSKLAYAEGWRCISEMTLCPDCAKRIHTTLKKTATPRKNFRE